MRSSSPRSPLDPPMPISDRNNPLKPNVLSGLSAYFQFRADFSPTLCFRGTTALNPQAVGAFLEELAVCRELANKFCWVTSIIMIRCRDGSQIMLHSWNMLYTNVGIYTFGTLLFELFTQPLPLRCLHQCFWLRGLVVRLLKVFRSVIHLEVEQVQAWGHS